MLRRKVKLATRLTPRERHRRLRMASVAWWQMILLTPSRRPVRVAFSTDPDRPDDFELFSLFNAAWAHGSVSQESTGNVVRVTFTLQWIGWIALLLLLALLGISATSTKSWILLPVMGAVVALAFAAVWFEHRIMNAFLVETLELL